MELLGQGFTWLDTGTHESLVDATNFVKTIEQHQHRKIACLEEIGYLNGWISKDEVLKVYEVLKKNQYGQYLKDVLDGKYQPNICTKKKKMREKKKMMTIIVTGGAGFIGSNFVFHMLTSTRITALCA